MNNNLKKEKRMHELNKLIELIQSMYDENDKNWRNSKEYQPLNMKKKRVEDVYKDESLLLYVLNYRKFINDNISDVVDSILELNLKSVVNTRVKSYNSIQYKIQNYENNHENGKIPLKKCLNDIFGLRIILDIPVNFNEIKEDVDRNFPNLKCIESLRGEYYAIHIYFGNDDNYKFQWELQVWDKGHEKTNLESHAKYKQDYTKWEIENI
jgi:hypothetical protein